MRTAHTLRRDWRFHAGYGLLLFCSAGLTATAAFAAAAAAIAFFRFEYEFSQEEEYAGEHNQADDNILSHDDSILEEIW